MAEEPRTPQDDPEEPASTPFDSPWFLPVLLWLFAGWFGYDIVTDAEAYREWPWFNRGGLAVTGGLALWFTRRAILERRAGASDGE
jgi:hypothetical protein